VKFFSKGSGNGIMCESGGFSSSHERKGIAKVRKLEAATIL